MTELKAHQRSNIPCPLRDEEMVEGIDGEQEAKLKSRRKEYTKKTEPEKWHTVYRILFPGDDPEHAPSPCKILILF
jgi:hypothetical protein